MSFNVLLCGWWIHAGNKDGILLCDHIVAATTSAATAAAAATVSYKTEPNIRKIA